MVSVFRVQIRGRTSAASAPSILASSCQIGWCIGRVAFSTLRVDVFSPLRRQLRKNSSKITNSHLISQFITFSLCFVFVRFTWLDVGRRNPSFGHSWRRWTIDARCEARRWWRITLIPSLVIVSVLRVHGELRSVRCVWNVRVSISIAVQSLLLLLLLHVIFIVVVSRRRFASGSSSVIEPSTTAASWSVVSRSAAWPVEPVEVSLSSKTVRRASIEP